MHTPKTQNMREGDVVGRVEKCLVRAPLGAHVLTSSSHRRTGQDPTSMAALLLRNPGTFRDRPPAPPQVQTAKRKVVEEGGGERY